MALSFLVRLRHGRFDAAATPGRGEWPPHPARLFCALVASVTDDADWVVLRWLEEAGSPQVFACAAASTNQARRSGYVVTNTTSPGGGSQSWPGRTSGERVRVSVLPAVDEFAVVWPQADADDATLGRLVHLARRVPYLGRSTSPVQVTVVPDVPEQRPGWTCFQPTVLGSVHSVELRVPYPGYAEQLRAVYAEGRRAWEVARAVAYAPDTTAAVPPGEDPPVSGAYTDLVVFGFDGPLAPIPGNDVLTVTQALRKATLSRVANPVPPQVSGHDAGGRPHVAFLALPDAGHRYADGHLLGVAVAVPQQLPTADRRRLLRGLLADGGMHRLNLPGGRRIALSYQPDRVRPRGLLPERWTGDGARSWTTVTPVMLDRYPKAHTAADELVARALVSAGYPRPEQVDLLPAPAVAGGVFAWCGSLPEGRARRPLLHCRVRFPRPVRGPVLAGALRYLGVGLFVPEHEGSIL